MNLQTYFKKEGYDISANATMLQHIANWKSWYEGEVKAFHNYVVYNGEKKVPQKRASLQMGKKVCEDWANLLLNEKVTLGTESEGTQSIDYANEVLKDNDFWVMGNQGVEIAFALGTGAFVSKIDDMEYNENTGNINTEKGKTVIEFVLGDKIHPLSYLGNNIIECAFITNKMVGKISYAYVAMHVLNEVGNYVIKNRVLKVTRGGYTDVTEQQEGLVTEFDTGSSLKWFSIIKPNIVNNVKLESPYGVSIFGNSISTLKGTDIAYDSFTNEFILGRKRIFVSTEALSIDVTTGVAKLNFDPNDIVFYSIPQSTDGKNMIEGNDMEIRAEEHERGINMNLNLLSVKCGFGDKQYRFTDGTVETATQVISENSTLFRSVKKHEILLRQCLVDLLSTIVYIGNKFLGQSLPEGTEFVINFDDSIIEDKGAEMVRDLQLVSSGIMNAWEFRVKYFNESAEEAKKLIPQTVEIV